MWYLLLFVKFNEMFLHTLGLLEMSKIMLKRQYSAITCSFHGVCVLCSKYMHVSVV
jgi:hypothetical protein